MGKRKKDRARETQMIERMMKYDSEITKRLGKRGYRGKVRLLIGWEREIEIKG